jgi:hypothetical protein
VADYLQGIRPSGQIHAPEVVNSNRRCKILAEKLKDIENGADLIDWIKQTFSPSEAAAEVWLLIFLIEPSLIDPSRSWSQHGSWLWALMQGENPPTGVGNCFDVALESKFQNKIHKDNFLKIHLHIRESDRGWYLIPNIPKNFQGTRAQQEAAVSVMRLEALRQQLDEGNGICCAYYTPDRCVCELYWREALLRISQWAKEGKFGCGEWSDLPPECTSRN